MAALEKNGRPRPIAVLFWVLVILGLYSTIGSGTLFVLMLMDRIVNPSVYTPSDSLIEHASALVRRYGPWIHGTTSLYQWILFLGLTWWGYGRLHGRSLLADSRLLPFRIRGFLGGALAGVALVLPAILLQELLFTFFPGLEVLRKVSEALNDMGKDWGNLGFYIFSLGVTPAVCEEVLFRGYFQQTLARAWSARSAALFSGVFFALIHQNALGIFALTLGGLVLAWLYLRYQNLGVTMGCHFAYNLLNVLLFLTPLAESLGTVLTERRLEGLVLSLVAFLLALKVLGWPWPAPERPAAP